MCRSELSVVRLPLSERGRGVRGEFLERVDDEVCVEVVVRREHRDGAHPGSAPGLEPVRRVFEDHATIWLDAEALGGQEHPLRIGLAGMNVLRADDRSEV